MKRKTTDSRLLTANFIYIILYIVLCALGGCAEYQPPFTHYLTHDMNFETVRAVAAEKGYHSFSQVADYRGYRLLDFVKNDDGSEVFLVVDPERRPVMRTFGFGRIDSDTLVNFVDDLIQHQQRES